MKRPIADNKLDSLDILSPRPGRPCYILPCKVAAATGGTVTVDLSSYQFSKPPQVISAVYGVAVDDSAASAGTPSGTITFLGVSANSTQLKMVLTGTGLDATNGYVNVLLQAFA